MPTEEWAFLICASGRAGRSYLEVKISYDLTILLAPSKIEKELLQTGPAARILVSSWSYPAPEQAAGFPVDRAIC